jgi:superfamily I DNA/RNA helicase
MPALEDGILPYLEAEIFAPSGEGQGLPRPADDGYGNDGLNWGETGGRENGGPAPDASAEAHLAEEKRLFYVGLTRAREGLFLSRAEKRHLYGRALRLKPSRFLARLPVNKVRHSAEVAKHKITVEHLSLF